MNLGKIEIGPIPWRKLAQGKLGNGEIWEIGQWINPRRIEVGIKLDNTWT
jgi:hypothetical protein